MSVLSLVGSPRFQNQVSWHPGHWQRICPPENHPRGCVPRRAAASPDPESQAMGAGFRHTGLAQGPREVTEQQWPQVSPPLRQKDERAAPAVTPGSCQCWCTVQLAGACPASSLLGPWVHLKASSAAQVMPGSRATASKSKVSLQARGAFLPLPARQVQLSRSQP